ncbi:MAG: AAA family ATPase [Moorea sp. SIO2B7]|nr:AAA family ATPase [Moorena sp. SIO2B7]
MALRLQRIRLHNWKCYQDQIIKFDLDTNKNIWIVFGQNGAGKTSILEGILWCLYGSEVISRTELLKYFNRVNLKGIPDLEILVQLTFQGDSETYYISRRARRVVRGTTVYAEVEEASFNIDGQEKKDSRKYIEAILPNSCKDFFFFDGVEIKRYAQLTQTEESRWAIESILGIPELKNLRDDAKLAFKNIEKKLNNLASASKEVSYVNEKLLDIQDEIEVTKGQLQEAKGKYNASVEILKNVQERASKIEYLRGKLNQIVRLEQEKVRLEDNLKNAEEQIETTLRKAPIPLILEFVREVADDLQIQSRNNIRQSGSLGELQKLLTADNCLCGRCIDEDIRAYIRQQLKQLEGYGKINQQTVEEDELRHRLALLSKYQTPDFDKLLLNRDRLQDNLDEVQQAISRLKRDTKGVNQEEIKEIWKKVGGEEQVVREKQQRIYRLQGDIEGLKKQEDQLSRTRESLASRNQETAMLSKQVKLARGLADAANELIEWHINKCKETLEERTSEIHRRVTNKPDEYVGVEIKNNYTLGVKSIAGDTINPEVLSAGEKEALAFAFITGLNLASATAAPLIMDTPFGHLDTKHQKNIVNSLPDIPSQVIVLATDRDFPEYLLQELRPHVAEIHRIRRLGGTEDASTVENVD